ncbi:hypothetical protein BIW11_10186 [Tropilaelaps mercedesae]|uniref:Uncharacterized protein n=1 Tax=Tropilaelaps mercedesae TaxID=418985 RepID=A0A1V9XGX5_9ACAR|nr:hypothetical protein BIW11_10186 [Tropilaelaps mercedesae]
MNCTIRFILLVLIYDKFSPMLLLPAVMEHRKHHSWVY